MSRISDLRNNSENCVNIVDMVSLLVPNQQPKYIETILRIMKKSKDMGKMNEHVKLYLNKELGLSAEDINKIPEFQLVLHYKFLTDFFDTENVKNFQKFCELNERGLIENNDVTKYSDFNEISVATEKAQLKLDMKEMEKQVVKIHEDNEWVVVRPLTYAASCKYGSNTKWCTTFSESSYFSKYSSNGILLYMINKDTGLKVACYKALNGGDKEFSFWNQVDIRIDSLESGLPLHILDVIMEEVRTNQRSNYTYLTDEMKEKYEGKKSLKRQILDGDNSHDIEEEPSANYGFDNEEVSDSGEYQYETDEGETEEGETIGYRNKSDFLSDLSPSQKSYFEKYMDEEVPSPNEEMQPKSYSVKSSGSNMVSTSEWGSKILSEDFPVEENEQVSNRLTKK